MKNHDIIYFIVVSPEVDKFQCVKLITAQKQTHRWMNNYAILF